MVESELLADAAVRYLPHGGAALLLREVLEASPESMQCVARFPGTNSLVVDGRAATHLVVEQAAQAAAAHLAILALDAGVKIRGFEGFLASARNVVLAVPDIPADTDITITVRPRGRIRTGQGGLCKFRFDARLEGAEIARGELSTYVMPVESDAR